jgi:FkbM family methyltransferase
MFSYLRAGDGVVYVGANLGIYTVACASLGAVVSAIEPSSVSRPVLEHNISINELQNRVQVFATALGKECGNAALTTDLDGANHLVDVEEGPHHEVVQIRTLDSLVDENSQWFGPQKISFIKVDAEGHDESVLHGARSTIEAHQPVILVESWAGGTEIRALLSTMNYRVYRFDIVEQRLVEYPVSWSGQANFIAIAEDRLDSVEVRLHERRFTSMSQPQIRWKVQDMNVEGSTH